MQSNLDAAWGNCDVTSGFGSPGSAIECVS